MKPTTYNLPACVLRTGRQPTTSSSGGYIALTATVIVALAMLLLAVSVSVSGYYGRFTIFDTELKAMSRTAAEACVDVGILKLAQADLRGETIVGDDFFPMAVSLGEHECIITSIDSDIGEIAVQAVVGNAYTTLEVSIATDVDGNYVIDSWKEVQ